VPSEGEPSCRLLQAVDRSGNVVGAVGKPGDDWLMTRVVLGCYSTRHGGLGTMRVLELCRVRRRVVGFGRVASQVVRLPLKPDRVRKYLGGMYYQYTPLYPASVSGPGGSTTPPVVVTMHACGWASERAGVRACACM
jgi:hypothetical protein